MLKKQQVIPNFITPIIMEGSFATSVPKSIQKILALDFSGTKYYEGMIERQPMGLLPMLFGPEDFAKDYTEILDSYHTKINNIKMQVGK